MPSLKTSTAPRSPQAAAEGTFSRDFAASIVIFLVALPLCMGVSIASGVPVAAGLVTGIVAGIVVGFLAGCPLQVSGPTAGLTVVIYEAVQTYGLKMLGVIVLLAGLMQLVAGLLRFGQWFRAVSPAVVHGMLAGIGVLIFASQFHVMLDDTPASSGVKNLLTIPTAIQKAFHIPQLPETDIRADQQAILKELGDLHRRQIGLNEEVTEQVPNHHVELQPDAVIDLSRFVDRQQAILSELQAIQERGISVMSTQQSKQQRVRELGDQAIKALEVSLNALKENRNDIVIPAEIKAAETITGFQAAFKNHEIAAFLGVLTIILLVSWKAFAKGRLAVVPAPLIGIVAATLIAEYWKLPVNYVELPTTVTDDLHFLKLSILADVQWGSILLTAMVVAIAASAETLLCATAVDAMQTGPRTNYDKELCSQGVGNLICGFLGALPMTGVIVRSSANVQAGAKSRKSSMMHGCWFIVSLVFLSALLRMIPTTALAGILVYTGYRQIDRSAVKQLFRYGWSDVFIWAVTVIVIVAQTLLVGVIVGMLLATGKLVLRFSKLRVSLEEGALPLQTLIRLEGNASFLRLPKLSRVLDRVPQGATVTFDVQRLAYLDQACLELLVQWGETHVANGGEVHVNWDALGAFAQSGDARGLVASEYARVA